MPRIFASKHDCGLLIHMDDAGTIEPLGKTLSRSELSVTSTRIEDDLSVWEKRVQ